MVEFLIEQLLTSKDERIAGYLEKYTFHIIPIMNPDGFVITQTTDRLHRKNAQRYGNCTGVDSMFRLLQPALCYVYFLAMVAD